MVKTDVSVLPMGHLLSVQVGMPQKMTTIRGREWESAIVKESIAGRVVINPENVAGDKQANQKYHGGPSKAVCGYSLEHFAVWHEEFGLVLPFGAFGENITVSGLTEDILCLGDLLEIGSVQLQISQPRMPCANVAKRWNCRELPERMMATGFTGFYCRVLKTGEIEAGQRVRIVARYCPEWTILRMNQTLYQVGISEVQVRELQAISQLTGEWKRALGRKLKRSQEDS
jgi:MOSC domain-containing protein YiiM